MNEETLFHEALARPAAERAAFLDQACAGQPELRAAVEALLAAHEASGSLLDKLPAEVGGTVDSEHFTGEFTPKPEGAPIPSGPTVELRTKIEAGLVILGRYTLQEKIGEGGMGEVWVARQTEPVKRKVAIKLIKTGMDSKAVLARFEQERQALAIMDHPNIARVLDGGMTPLGQPFFVMELVNGLQLTRFCDEAKLTPNERLELFVPICQAVQHAHQKGIVHRDLKPANILVTLIDGKPVPKVIDFGVAKATAGKLTDESFSTHFGAVVGTLEYMSPEQAGFSGIDIDTRADIYSLGVILYELLTGLRPIDASRLERGALAEMIRIIQEEEPSRPSTRLSTDAKLPSLAAARQTEPRKLMAWLRGELDWVVMKCLEKQRDRRYETASSLARDIERFLADEPVEARPQSTRYRLARFLRRHRGPVIAACLILLVLIGGIISTSFWLVEAREQTRRAVQEAQAKEEARRNEADQRALAERANKQAYEALKSFTDELMEKVLGGRTQLSNSEKSILQSAQKQWEVFAQSKGDSPEARVIRSDGAENLALVQAKLGMAAEAEPNYRLALEIRSELASEFPGVPRYRLTWARSHQNLGSALRANGKSAEAEVQFTRAVAVFEKLVAEFPDVREYRSRLAESHISRGNALRDRGELTQAGEQYRTALAHQEKLVAGFPDVHEYRWSVARSHWGLAFLNKRLKEFAQSEGHYRKALETGEELLQRIPTSLEYRRDVASLHREMGVMLYDSGNNAGGAAEFPRVLELQGSLAAELPSMPQYRVELARSHRDFGRVLGLLAKPAEALDQFGKAEALLEKLVADNPTVLPYQADLGLTYSFHGDLQSAGVDAAQGLTWYDKSIYTLTAAFVQNRQLVLTRNSLSKAHAGRAAALDKLKRYAEAVKDWDKAVELAPPDKLLPYRAQRADSLLRLGKVSEAIAEVAVLTTPDADAPGSPSAEEWYGFACIYAVASGKIAGKKQEYASRAIELLQKAVRLGFENADRMAKDPDLDSLRDRDDFKQLLQRGRESFPEGK